MGTIKVLTSGDDLRDTRKGGHFASKSVLSGSSNSESDGHGGAKIREVDTAVLKQNLNSLVEELQGVIGDINSSPECTLRQVTVGVEASASGGVSLIGTVEVGAKAAITLTFERS